MYKNWNIFKTFFFIGVKNLLLKNKFIFIFLSIILILKVIFITNFIYIKNSFNSNINVQKISRSLNNNSNFFKFLSNEENNNSFDINYIFNDIKKINITLKENFKTEFNNKKNKEFVEHYKKEITNYFSNTILNNKKNNLNSISIVKWKKYNNLITIKDINFNSNNNIFSILKEKYNTIKNKKNKSFLEKQIQILYLDLEFILKSSIIDYIFNRQTDNKNIITTSISINKTNIKKFLTNTKKWYFINLLTNDIKFYFFFQQLKYIIAKHLKIKAGLKSFLYKTLILKNKKILIKIINLGSFSFQNLEINKNYDYNYILFPKLNGFSKQDELNKNINNENNVNKIYLSNSFFIKHNIKINDQFFVENEKFYVQNFGFDIENQYQLLNRYNNIPNVTNEGIVYMFHNNFTKILKTKIFNNIKNNNSDNNNLFLNIFDVKNEDIKNFNKYFKSNADLINQHNINFIKHKSKIVNTAKNIISIVCISLLMMLSVLFIIILHTIIKNNINENVKNLAILKAMGFKLFHLYFQYFSIMLLHFLYYWVSYIIGLLIFKVIKSICLNYFNIPLKIYFSNTIILVFFILLLLIFLINLTITTIYINHNKIKTSNNTLVYSQNEKNIKFLFSIKKSLISFWEKIITKKNNFINYLKLKFSIINYFFKYLVYIFFILIINIILFSTIMLCLNYAVDVKSKMFDFYNFNTLIKYKTPTIYTQNNSNHSQLSRIHVYSWDNEKFLKSLSLLSSKEKRKVILEKVKNEITKKFNEKNKTLLNNQITKEQIKIQIFPLFYASVLPFFLNDIGNMLITIQNNPENLSDKNVVDIIQKTISNKKLYNFYGINDHFFKEILSIFNLKADSIKTIKNEINTLVCKKLNLPKSDNCIKQKIKENAPLNLSNYFLSNPGSLDLFTILYNSIYFDSKDEELITFFKINSKSKIATIIDEKNSVLTSIPIKLFGISKNTKMFNLSYSEKNKLFRKENEKKILSNKSDSLPILISYKLSEKLKKLNINEKLRIKIKVTENSTSFSNTTDEEKDWYSPLYDKKPIEYFIESKQEEAQKEKILNLKIVGIVENYSDEQIYINQKTLNYKLLKGFEKHTSLYKKMLSDIYNNKKKEYKNIFNNKLSITPIWFNAKLTKKHNPIDIYNFFSKIQKIGQSESEDDQNLIEYEKNYYIGKKKETINKFFYFVLYIFSLFIIIIFIYLLILLVSIIYYSFKNFEQIFFTLKLCGVGNFLIIKILFSILIPMLISSFLVSQLINILMVYILNNTIINKIEFLIIPINYTIIIPILTIGIIMVLVILIFQIFYNNFKNFKFNKYLM